MKETMENTIINEAGQDMDQKLCLLCPYLLYANTCFLCRKTGTPLATDGENRPLLSCKEYWKGMAREFAKNVEKTMLKDGKKFDPAELAEGSETVIRSHFNLLRYM